MRSTLLWVLLSVFFRSAFSQHNIHSSHICLPPPLPPYFIPQQENEQSNNGRASGYAVPFDTVTYNHTLNNQALDVVICFDGVTNNTDIEKCDRYVDSLVARLQTVAHYNPRFKYFNIYRIALLSNESGSAWGFDGDTTIDNRYGSRFNAFQLERLIIPVKYDTLFNDITSYVPNYDVAIMLVNDKKYGGSGWNLFDGRKVACFSLEEESGWHLGDEIIIHEMQHIMPFAGHGYLGDEYEDSVACLIYDSIPYAPNFTADTINERKWEHCIGQPGVGFYPNAGICEGNYRPTDDCIMHRVFTFPPFCPVCRENSTAWLDSMINPLYDISANAPDFSGGTHTFSVNVDAPTTNTYRYQWWLDNNLVAQNTLSHTIDFSTIDKSQNHTLRFVCTDVDPFIIDTTLRRPWKAEWELLTYDSTVGLEHFYLQDQTQLYPNPAHQHLTIEMPSALVVTAEIVSPDGKIISRKYSEKAKLVQMDIADLCAGMYYVVLRPQNGPSVVKKFLVE